MKKHILFILPSLSVGGLERVQVTISNALAAHGYNVTVMILDAIDDLKTELSPQVHLIHKPYKDHLGRKLPYIRHKFYDDGMWETRATPQQLHDYYVGHECYDVEIGFFRGLAVKIISGGAKKNHNDFRRAVGYRNNFKSMDEVFAAYASFDHVVCVSEEAKQGFIEVVGDTGNLVTVYNMLPADEIRHKAQETLAVTVPKEKLHVVLVGRLLDSAKGQKRLINAVSRLHNEGKSISLALVGGGCDEQMLRSEIATRHAEAYITLCGSQMNPYPFIREADLLVCASYFEGYNLTVAEALILGTPVLSTDCTGPNEILDHGKYGKIVANSEDGLYCGLKEIAENPEFLKDLRSKAAERQDFFDEDKLLAQIEELF